MPPPRPLSAGPFAQPDPWSLAPKEGINDWLNEQESQSGPEPPLIHQNSMDIVNLDEEAGKLMEQQQAYKAAAQILQTARDLFDTIIRIM